ncbi:MAG: ATP-dependent 6-phosphofructokinase [Prevotellaceae bacterium]|jgi:6-phosphofructokinase 1|nr:ATP-dependent 6-phosphofructokinase [Prevotellaceae bacterium]
MRKKKVLIATSGGDCPGLNAVLRSFVKRAGMEKNPEWEVWGSIQSFNGLLGQPQDLRLLDRKAVSGIHVKGGTIIGTTKRGGPFNWPVKQSDGSYTYVDRSDEMIQICKDIGFDAVVNIGGDGSQAMSKRLFDKGLPIIGVPKTIDNDLGATDVTFGFQSAVDVAAEAVDRLVSTAESHNRILVLEVMGKNSGWIALHASVAGGAEICLLPEIPYDIRKIKHFLDQRFEGGKKFAVVVVAEGAMPKGGIALGVKETELSSVRFEGAAQRLAEALQLAGIETGIRCTILGHVQRGGGPVPYDRVLASQYGVKAFEMVREGQFGHMVAFQANKIVSVPFEDVSNNAKFVDPDCFLVHTAKSINICFGD